MDDRHSTDSDLLIDIIRRSPMLEELQGNTRPREELVRRLDVSSATYYRYTNWLDDRGLVEESSEGITLTASGEIITEEVVRFERAVLSALRLTETDRDLFLDVIRYAPALEALGDSPRDRRELERQFDVSRTTCYRVTRAFQDQGLIEKSGGRYALTAAGEEIREAVATVETNVETALRLGPVLEALHDDTPVFDLDAFTDATVTTAEHGDPYSPVRRCLELVEKTDRVRGVYIGAIVPLYLSDIGQRIIGGMDTVNVGSPERIAEVLAEAPAKCLEVCASGHFTVYLHDDLSYSLVILDDRVGIGVLQTDTRRAQMFVDTDSPVAREWAEAVFESYKAEAVKMEGFSPWEVRRAVERGSLEVDSLIR